MIIMTKKMYKLFFTYWETKDSILTNIIRYFMFTKILLNTMLKCNVQGGTLTKNVGFWQGKKEPSYLLELANISPRTARQLARQLKIQYNQDSVMIVNQN